MKFSTCLHFEEALPDPRITKSTERMAQAREVVPWATSTSAFATCQPFPG